MEVLVQSAVEAGLFVDGDVFFRAFIIEIIGPVRSIDGGY